MVKKESGKKAKKAGSQPSKNKPKKDAAESQGELSEEELAGASGGVLWSTNLSTQNITRNSVPDVSPTNLSWATLPLKK